MAMMQRARFLHAAAGARVVRGSRLRVAAAVAAGGAGGLALWLRGADDEFCSITEESLPLVYDPAAISAVWREHPRCAVARLGVIGAKAAPFCGALVADLVRGGPESADALAARQAERARQLRSLLVELGPTFIKFGQMLSIRPDVLPPPAIYELQKLCDAVPSYPTREALALVEAELGAPAAELFEGLDAETRPIAAIARDSEEGVSSAASMISAKTR